MKTNSATTTSASLRIPPENPGPNDLYTFEEWSHAGFQIIKGSRSGSRNKDLVPLFDGTQVQRGLFGGKSYKSMDGDPDDSGENDDCPFDFADTQDFDPYDDIPL